ncbi:MFS general substrate transporter [Thelephora ganbajun]|uniref:MFS general substrate transporter n=1 Tax=Thelephora ganbajun TaxID=370292 RepID=A0ACB6Z5H1_THEGA|nr:MFS general substrate transporter [Thelephora ganbajun]
MSNDCENSIDDSPSNHSSIKDGVEARDTIVHSRTAKEIFPNVDEDKVLRKIDIRVVPVLCLLYLLAFLDRVNIANAAIYGMKEELRLKGNEYNIALVIFFVPYIVFKIPGNFLLKKFRPHVWLSSCMFLFRAVTVAQGTIRSYSGLLITHFLLGVIVFHLSGHSSPNAHWHK